MNACNNTIESFLTVNRIRAIELLRRLRISQISGSNLRASGIPSGQPNLERSNVLANYLSIVDGQFPYPLTDRFPTIVRTIKTDRLCATELTEVYHI